MIYGPAYSLTTIDAEPIPVIRPDLLPWLIKDRREAEEGCMVYNAKDQKLVHDGSGLTKAKQAMRAAEALAEANAEKMKADPEVATFIERQVSTAQDKFQFYTGKVHLLDRIITATKSA